jgi:hypothetical protein
MRPETERANVFAAAFALLRRNWIIVVPSLVVGAIGAAIAGVVSSQDAGGSFSDYSGGPGVFLAFLNLIVGATAQILAAIVAIAFTTGMAGAAWTRGTASLADGAQAFKREGVRVFFAMVLLLILGFIAAVLAEPTFFISLVAYATFMIYTMAAVIVGDRPAVQAILDSISIAARNFGTTILVVALIFGIAILASLVGRLAHGVPFVGPVLETIVLQVVVAYATLVVVGEYLKLRPHGG